MDKKSFTTIVQRAMGGDQTAFAQLCEHVVKDVLYICIRYTGDYHAGEDAAQEVLMHVQKNITRLKAAEAFYAWLNRVITGVCVSQARKNKRTAFMQFEDLAADIMEDKLEFLPLEWAEKEDTRQIVLGALKTLPFKYQQALYMHYLMDMPIKEMASSLDIKEGTAKVTLHRARGMLKARIETDNKIDLKEYSLKGGAIVPPLALVLRADVLALVQEDSIQLVMDTANVAGIGIGAGALAASTNAAASTAAASSSVVAGVATTTAATVTAAATGGTASVLSATALTLAGTALVGLAVGGAVIGSSPAPDVSVELPSPQSVVYPQSIQQGAGDIIWESEESFSFVAPSEAQQMQPTEPEDVTSSQPQEEPPPRFTQTVTGRLALMVEGEELENSGGCGEGFLVSVYHGDTLVSKTEANAQGEYILSFRAAQGRQYILCVTAPGSRYCGFASDGEEETIPFAAATGQVEMPTVYLEDNNPPSGAVELFSANDLDSTMQDILNPAWACLTVNDETPVFVLWQVVGKDGRQVAEGKGALADLTALYATTNGVEYQIVFTATDAGGNTAEFRQWFWMQL